MRSYKSRICTPPSARHSTIHKDRSALVNKLVLLCAYYSLSSGGTTPGQARANALVKKPLPWSLPCQKFCPAENLFGAYTAPALAACMIALAMPWLHQMSGAATELES